MHRRLLIALLVTTAPSLALTAEAPARPAGETMYVHLTGEDGKPTKVPLFAESSATVPVARVDSQLITLQDLTAAIENAHKAMGKDTKAGHKDFSPILDRMVDVKLLMLEASDMGLADLPEVKAAVAQYKEQVLHESLQAYAMSGAKADPAEVERLFRETVKEWKLQSVLFPKPDDAKAFVAQVKAGKRFEDAAKQAVADKKAKSAPAADFVPADKMLPDVVVAVAKLKKGTVGAPIKLKDGYAVVRFEDVRYPANAKARAEAEQKAETLARQRALKKYYAGLLKKYVTTDEALLKKLDFEAKKPGRAALEKDTRVLSRIEGEKPITVGDLATQLYAQYYHGAENAIKEKKVNKRKGTTLDGLISLKIVPKEARRLGLDKTPEYQKRVEDFRTQTVFSAFVEKVILPEIKVTDADQKRYYDQHKADEFTLTGFYKLENIAFPDIKKAQTALDKLKSGTDFRWLRQNAEGQVPEPDRVLKLEGNTISAKAMPAELQKLLAGTKPGDYRLYAGEKSQFNVVRVVEVTPPEVEPFAQAQPGINQKLFAEAVSKGIRGYADKLRKAHTVKVYITKIGS